MKFLVVKVKDKDLYFNADEVEDIRQSTSYNYRHTYVCDTPMLMGKALADSIMKYADELYNYDTDEQFTNNDLEIREVEVNLI